MLAPLDFSACANFNQAIGQPVGASIGNAGTTGRRPSRSRCSIRPQAIISGLAGPLAQRWTIKLSVASPTAVYALMNTQYGQAAIANATVLFKGTGQTHKSFRLTGNKTIPRL